MGYALGLSAHQAVASFPDALVPQAYKAVGASFATYSSSQYPRRTQLLRCSTRGHCVGRVFLSAVACIAAVVLLISICSKTQLRGHSIDSRSRRLSSNDRTKRGFEEMCDSNAEEEDAWLQSEGDEVAGQEGPLHKKPRVSAEGSENSLSEQVLEGSSGTGGGVGATSEHRAQVAPNRQHLPPSKTPASIAAMKWTADELEATASLFQLRVGHEYAVRLGPVEGVPGTTLYIEPKEPPHATSVQKGKQSKRRIVKLATFLKTSRPAGGAASAPAGERTSASTGGPAGRAALEPSGGPESGLASERARGTASGPVDGPSSDPAGGLTTGTAAGPVAGPSFGSSSELIALLTRVPEARSAEVTATSNAVGNVQGTTHGTSPGTVQETTYGSARGITGGPAAGTEIGVAAAAATGDGDNALPGISGGARGTPSVEHPYFRLPKVEQTLGHQPVIPRVRPDTASETHVAPLSPLSLLRKAHNLLSKDCLVETELHELTITTELLVMHAMQYQRRPLPQDRPSRAVAMLGMRFLIFDVIVSTLNIIGQPARGPWWDRLVASVPHSYREIVLPENARTDAKFNKMLITRLVACIAILKTGKRPFRGEVIMLKDLLFSHEFSPSRFRREEFGLSKEDQAAHEK